jgi:hypothetical protein
MYFYPRKDYKYIFDKDKFLVLGEKGVGKTALFSVLSHSKYAIALANFCGISNEEIQKTEWVIGLEKDNLKFPDKANFDALSDFTISQLRNYWLILLIKQLSKYVPDSDMKKEIMNLTNKSIKDLATRKNIGEDLYELLSEVNTKLSTSNKTLIIVYDHLDAVLSNENHVRGRLVSALLSFYYDNYNRFSQIKAKIFLRNDIFNREVNDITDKVKIQNYAVEIKWDYNQLLNIIWKRIYEQDKILFPELQNIGSKEFSNEEINKKLDILGNIPNLLSKEEHEVILHKIFGKRMGGNNKTYPYNWLRTHTEDTNNQIHPRTLIRLFSESAKLQSADNEQPKDGVIRSKNIETALKNKVSKQQIQELGEEYPEFREIFANLVNKVENGRSPMNENNLIRALEKLNIEDAINTIEKLKEIGLLKEYKAYAKTKVNNEEKRYHIPDLYLSGLGFTRLGTN